MTHETLSPACSLGCNVDNSPIKLDKFCDDDNIINPQCMHESYGSGSVCVSYRASCYICYICIESQVLLGHQYRSQRMCCVDFIENALFESSGNIC